MGTKILVSGNPAGKWDMRTDLENYAFLWHTGRECFRCNLTTADVCGNSM